MKLRYWRKIHQERTYGTEGSVSLGEEAAIPDYCEQINEVHFYDVKEAMFWEMVQSNAKSGYLMTMNHSLRVVHCDETNTNKGPNYNSALMFVATAPNGLVLAERETLRGGLN